MSDIEKEIRASVRLGAFHGDAFERGICEKQAVRAADEIAALRAEVERVTAQLAAERERLREAVALMRQAMELRHSPVGDPLPLSVAERTALHRIEEMSRAIPAPEAT